VCGITSLVTKNAQLRAEDCADVERMTSYMQARGASLEICVPFVDSAFS